MSSQPRKVVVDASALVAYVQRETGYQAVARALPVCVVPVPNAAEAVARCLERGYKGTAADLLDDLQELGVVLEPVLPGDAARAAELIATTRKQRLAGGYGISLGDSLCIAVAERLNLPLLGGDKLWDKVTMSVQHRLFRK